MQIRGGFKFSLYNDVNMISHSFTALPREISRSTLKINLVFPRTHVLFSMYLLRLKTVSVVVGQIQT